MGTLSKRVLIATTNAKKGGEMLQILSAALPDVEFVTLEQFPDAPEVDEAGETFAENSRLKAISAAKHTGLITIADDGGLCIDALEGRPGVKSHRFLGAETSFATKMTRILEMLDGLPAERRACRFKCAVVIAAPGNVDGEIQTMECEGLCEGMIGYEICGEHGFGYDPIFYLPELSKYMAQLSPVEKHKISHRGKALKCALQYLAPLLLS